MLKLAQRFGTNLKRLRKEKGITQAALGLEINATEDTIANYESGRRWPDVETIEALALVLGVDCEELFKKIS